MIEQTTLKRRQIALLAAAGGLLVALIAGWFSALAYAQAQEGELAEITEEKIELVRANCVAAQVSIQRLQNNDVVIRTNRGRSYENVLKLMASFNARVAANKLTEPRLIETTGIMQRNVTAFYRHYDSYKDTIEKLMRVNCRDQPVSFYRDLQTLRSQRDVLQNDVVILDKHVADYQALVADLKGRLAAPSQEVAQ